MASKKIPVIQKLNMVYVLIQIILFLTFVAIFSFISIGQPYVLALAFYFLFSVYLKVLIPKWHRKGVFYTKKGELEAAIFSFEKSIHYFDKHKWLDIYRPFTLFSASKLSYTEMGLMNIVFCYNQLGNKEMAEKYFKRLRKQFPSNPYSLAS